MPAGPEEAEFLAGYDPRRYAPVGVTVDVVLLTIHDGLLQVLLIKRGGYPYKGAWALVGGFLDAAGDVSLEAAAVRELAEETGLHQGAAHIEQLSTFGDIARDPRTRVVSVAYLALVPSTDAPVAGSDADEARFFPVADLLCDRQVVPLAFDHKRILTAAVERARAKLEYTTVATAFCGDEFTLSDLQAVYETVWGFRLDKRNFRRWVLTRDGFVEETDGVRGGPDSGVTGRPAQLYRAGGASVLYPPLLRDRQISLATTTTSDPTTKEHP